MRRLSEPSHLDLRCLTFSLSTLHINVFPSDSLLKQKKKKKKKKKTDSSEQSGLGPHCLPVCKNKFEKFARIFSRRHKQTTFSDASFLGILRVNAYEITATVTSDPLESMFFVFFFSCAVQNKL